MPQDIEVMNFKSTKDIRGSFFNQVIICLKTLLERDDIVGTLMLMDEVLKRRMQAKSEKVWECKNKIDRWEVWEQDFDIVLGEQERMGIRGLVTELKSKGEDEAICRRGVFIFLFFLLLLESLK